MSDVAYTVRPTNKAMAYKCISKLVLKKDDAGQYQHDSATKFCENVKRELAGMFNLLNRANGMSKLIEATNNRIKTIKSIDAFTASDVLKKSKQEADKKTKESKSGLVYIPEITTRSLGCKLRRNYDRSSSRN
jgi:SPX domain protein involved in polyphosphate accumulation